MTSLIFAIKRNANELLLEAKEYGQEEFLHDKKKKPGEKKSSDDSRKCEKERKARMTAENPERRKARMTAENPEKKSSDDRKLGQTARNHAKSRALVIMKNLVIKVFNLRKVLILRKALVKSR